MPGDISMINDQEGEKKIINNHEPSDPNNSQINKGFELMLRYRSRRGENPKPKNFSILIDKVISILKREINFRFEFSLLINKKQK